MDTLAHWADEHPAADDEVGLPADGHPWHGADEDPGADPEGADEAWFAEIQRGLYIGNLAAARRAQEWGFRAVVDCRGTDGEGEHGRSHFHRGWNVPCFHFSIGAWNNKAVSHIRYGPHGITEAWAKALLCGL
jgi:hypothetical protein